MRCYNCPLAFEVETDWETGECDVVCAVTMDAVLGDDSCRRTNKWINSQNIDEVKDRYWTREGELYEKYMKEQGLI